MRCYRDSNGDYYYLEESGQKIYDDKVLKPTKDSTIDHAGSSSSSTSLSSDLISYLDELVGRILADNQIREERTMTPFDSMAKVS